MADNLDVRLRLQNARRFSSDSKRAAKDVDRIGDAADRTKRDAREAGSALRGIGAAGKFGFRGIGRLIGAAGGIYALGRGIRFVASEYTESARAGAQTDAVIKSTGRAAGISRSHVEGLAGALSRKAAIDDELIQSGANVLLTFKQIRNEAGRGNKMFDRATAAALDLSVAFGKDMRSSSVMVGKALNDPIKGITALNRVGVTFSEKQKEQVAALVESGDKLGAQKIIIKELESQVKGSAKAQAQPMDRLKVGWANLAESVGRLAAPAVNRGISKAADMVADLEDSLMPIWERGDLGFEEKMERSLPLVEKTFKKAKVGEALGDAVEAGAPIIADAMATAAPRAAKSFVNAFQNAGPWGKLATAAFLTHKLGGFRGAGGWAAGRFADRFGKRLSLTSIFRRTARQGAAAGSAEAIGTMTGQGAGSLSMWAARRERGFTRVGRGIGMFIGRGIVVGVIAGIALFGPEIKRFFQGVVDDALGDIDLSWGPFDLHPDIAGGIGGFRFPDFGGGGGGGRTHLRGLPDFAAPLRGGGGKHPRRRGPGAHTSSLPVRSLGGADAGGPIVIELQHTTFLDGEVVAKNSAKHIRRRRASK
jgi:hypothetical protein